MSPAHHEDNESISPRDLPPLHEVLGDILLQSPTSRSSRQGSPDSLRSLARDSSHYFAAQNYDRRQQLAPVAGMGSSQQLQPARRVSLSTSEASTSTHRPGSHSPTSLEDGTIHHSSAQAMSAHSYDLFDFSPDHGLVHKRSSKSQGDLEESNPKPRASSVHDSSRKYLCSTCGKRFSKPSTLKNHKLTHTGEKPFTCPHPGCGRPFSMSSNMQRHMRTHTSGSAFQVVHNTDEDVSSGKTSPDGSEE